MPRVKLSPNFHRDEFACKCGCGFDTVDAELVQVLEQVRKWAGGPVHILSGARCPLHNDRVGGAYNSQHLYGRAADFWTPGASADLVYKYLYAEFPDRFGLGRYPNRTHLDTRTGPAARWVG